MAQENPLNKCAVEGCDEPGTRTITSTFVAWPGPERSEVTMEVPVCSNHLRAISPTIRPGDVSIADPRQVQDQ